MARSMLTVAIHTMAFPTVGIPTMAVAWLQGEEAALSQQAYCGYTLYLHVYMLQLTMVFGLPYYWGAGGTHTKVTHATQCSVWKRIF